VLGTAGSFPPSRPRAHLSKSLVTPLSEDGQRYRVASGMANSYPQAVGLLDRRSERETLDRLLAEVRAGQSQVLVIRGEAGVGKSALLKYLAERASGCRVARAVGVESEMELPFAGLHQLCTPFLDHAERLPTPQRDALRTAFGLSTGETPDRFLVSLAVLSLLSEVAAERPLLCLIDDAQWQDQTTAQTLVFVARRLLAESVGLVFVVREPSAERVFAGLPELLVGGLAAHDSRVLLESAIRGRLDERVRDRIVAETRGNPLALLELPQGLTTAELAGGFGLPNVLLATRIEESFLRRLASLPTQTRWLLLIAAAEPVGDVSLLWRAAEQLGLSADAAAPAQAEGLIELGVSVRFRHPLVRSAAYGAAPVHDRQVVHRALADATDPELDPDRRTWHRAHATAGLDETVAAELERSADRAQRRGGVAAAAAFLERATALTPDPARRGPRALAAAQAMLEAGAPEAAETLIATAEAAPLDELHHARMARARAQIAFARRRGSDDPPLLLDAARRLEPLDAPLARETYLEALGAAIFAGRLSVAVGVRDVAEAARAAPRGAEPPRPSDLLLDGLATRFTEGYAAGVAPLRRAMRAFTPAQGGVDDDPRWLWMACRVAPEVWDYETWRELTTRGTQLAREAGALTVLPTALTYRAAVHVHAGEFAAASALIEEADAITAATGNVPLMYASLELAAWTGREAEALELIEVSIQDAAARGEGRAIGLTEHATAVLYNGLGRYEAAFAAAERACEHDDLEIFGWALTELVEAGVRSGAGVQAAAALERLETRTAAAGTDWALGIGARSRALLSDDEEAEEHYRQAIDRLARSRVLVHLARAQLVYGEWLRREQRRVDAREHLRTAHDTFRRLGAEAFAERARRELVATGETMPKRTVETRDRLTPQEAQIAQLAADGHTNPEIGALLFISPRTVEYHLRKVFTKLDISSRRELRDLRAKVSRALGPT
jgi:DNA-binding CsgD family transcriptional regulator/tetratricopeptide (TPR) repeat protein